MNKKYNVVVGGGIIGLLAYKILKSYDKNTILIEQSNKLGGLLSSLKIRNSYFDNGPHYLRETGNKKLDTFIFKSINSNWNSFKSLPQSNYFNGSWNNNSSYIDLRKKNKNLCKFSINYLNNLSKNNSLKVYQKEINNLKKLYSKRVTNSVIIPILKKYVGDNIKLLKNKSRFKFALNRLIVASPKITNKLKTKNFLDDIVGYNHFEKGISGRKNYYPKNGGIENFVNLFINKKDENKSYYLNTTINKIEIKNKMIQYLQTNNNKKLYVKKIIWTGPANILNQILYKHKFKKTTKTPKYYWYFFHLESKLKFKSKSFFAHIHDKNLKLFRLTFYDNFSNKKQYYRATAEVVFSKKLDIKKLENEIINELKQIKLISNLKKIIVVKKYMIPFNVYNPKMQIFKNKINNLFLYGQNNNNNKSMDTLMQDVFNDLKK